MILTAPHDDGHKYPTLGPQVVDWMHEHLVFGPGDLLGQPLQLDPEQQAFIWRFYELFPKGHVREGRRRFQRCTLSLAKGLRKTELAACIAAVEVHPDAPARFNGWRGKGLARGRGVTDPHVILVAYTEEQSDELAYGALKAILERCAIGDQFDIGLERIIRKTGDGKVVSLSGSPNARDGARTTFLLCDETHWWTLPRLKQAHQTMMNNLPKRTIADAWALETTTAPEPGAGSVAESTMEYARAVAEGLAEDATLFFFHREASSTHDLKTKEGARAAVIEASGPAASWRNIDAVVGLWSDPTTDRAYWERVWCNRLVKGATQAFDVVRWGTLTRPENPVQRGDFITLGFDGAQFHDSTALVATHIETGYQWMPGLWECPLGQQEWQVPTDEVDRLVRSLFADYTVWRMYADPPYWQSWLALWAGDLDKGRSEKDKRVVEWWTNSRKPMSRALENYQTAIRDSSLSHDGDVRLKRHLGNSRKLELTGMKDEQGKAIWLIQKERPDSPHKIDAAMASVLSWEARTDAVALGATKRPEFQAYVFGGAR
jgi:phage terminase large subunit-like protein